MLSHVYARNAQQQQARIGISGAATLGVTPAMPWQLWKVSYNLWGYPPSFQPEIWILAYLTFQDVGMMRLKYLLAQTMRSKDTNLLSTSLTIDSRTFSTVEPGSNQMMGKESLHTVQDAAG